MRFPYLTFEGEQHKLRRAFAFLCLLEVLAWCPRTGASRHNVDAESPDALPASAYAPLVEILTPLSLVRTYKVDRSFFPDAPPSMPPENTPSFGDPTVAPAPAHLKESWKDADELWAKAAAETVAQWNELGRSLKNAKTYSGILVDWSSNDCGFSANLPNGPTAWVAFVPFSPSSSTARRSCSLRVHILAAQKSGAVAAVVYYDEEDNDVTRSDTREKEDRNPDKPTRRHEEPNHAEEEEEIELAVAALRNSEAVRLLSEILRQRKEWIVINVTTFVQEPDAVEAIPQTEYSKKENANVFPNVRAPEQFSSNEASEQFSSNEGRSPVTALSPEESTKLREKRPPDGSFADSIVAGAFNLLTSIVIVFSAFCMLQLLSNSSTLWPLQNRYLSPLLSRIPFSAFWLTSDDQSEEADTDDENEDGGKFEKRNIHKLVLESFEIRRYSSAVEKDASRFPVETPSKVETGEFELCKPTERLSSSENQDVPSGAKERKDGSKRPEATAVAAFPLEEKRRPTCLSSPHLDQRRTFIAHRMPPASGSVQPFQLRSHSFSHPQSNPEQAVSGTNGGRPRAPPSLPTTGIQPNRSFTQPHVSPFGQRGYACTGPCPICLDDYEDGQTIRRLPCGHEYHVSCIDPWLLNSASYCPMCKTDYLEWPVPKGANDAATGIPNKIANFFAALFEPHSPTDSIIEPLSSQTDRRV